MKPEHKKYISENVGKKTTQAIAQELGLKKRQVVRYLEGRKITHPPRLKSLPQAPASRRSTVIMLIVLIFMVFAAYANSINGAFILDDEALVKNNILIKDLHNIPILFKTDLFSTTAGKPVSNSYRPMQTASYAIDFAIWKVDPRGYHLVNILIHICNTILVFLLIMKLFKEQTAAFAASLLFGLHPVNTACVSYISGRADLLVVMGMLTAVIGYIDYANSGRVRCLIISVLGYLAALFCKEYAILVVPFIILLYTAIFDQKNLFNMRRYIFYILPFAIYLPMRIQALREIAPRQLELAAVSQLARVLTSLKTWFIDMRILLLPYDLHFGRTTKIEYSAANPLAIAATIGIMAALFSVYYFYRKCKETGITTYGLVCLGISWFMLSMVPLVNILPLQAFLADSWLYFSSIGIYIAIAAALNYSWKAFFHGHAISRSLFVCILSAALAGYGAVTIIHNKNYRDGFSFYLSSVKWRPTVKFYGALADLSVRKNDYADAIKYGKRALETNRIYPSTDVITVYYSMGYSYMRMGKFDEARSALEKVMASNRDDLKDNTTKCLQDIKNIVGAK